MHSIQLRRIGFEDAPALTMQSTEGEIPRGRELNFSWLSGTILTGLTGVLLMGATLYVSFQGQATFSTAYEALRVLTHQGTTLSGDAAKTARARPIQKTQSEIETVEASVKNNSNGSDMIHQQPFMRIRATLATSATSL